jgi:acyl carrier protein
VQMEIESVIHRYVSDELMEPQGRSVTELSDETPLFRTGIIDSFGLLSLVQYLEEEFSISVRDDEMLPENFENIRTIARLVRTKHG